MNIVQALREHESNLKQQLAAVQSAITALNGSKTGALKGDVSRERSSGKRRLSAAGRAAISRGAKARWAKVRALRTKKK